MSRYKPAWVAFLGTWAAALGGCHPRPVPVPFDPIPMRDAVRIVNENTARVTETLRASGSVDGYFTQPEGRRISYHLDGTLFYLSPSYVRFDLKRFGDRKFLFGSNTDHYWYYDKEEDAYHCGRTGGSNDQPPEMPIRPNQIIDALGLTPIPSGPPYTGRTRLLQRVVDDYQQILFLEHDGQGRVVLEKEYWLDRYRPQLVRRVVFRDGDGVVEMESMLDDYKALSPGGPLLPHRMTADWPTAQGQMRFNVGNWTLVRGIRPDSVQFLPPSECNDR